MLHESNAPNPYEPTTIALPVHSKRGPRWYSCLWPIVGAVAGLVLLALITTGAKGTVNMTVARPLENCIFFFIFSFAICLIFAIWKSIRNLVRPILDAHPFLRIGCGFASILVLLPGIAMLKSLGILNMNEFPVSYNVVVSLIHGMVSVAIPVEVEQFLSKYFIAASGNALNTDANKAIHRSRGSAVS